ncbi:MAG TPA: DinB family protein [Bryobacteraceae bacterium]|nr:DinB family protein [Bryobacteraceae bacterium]
MQTAKSASLAIVLACAFTITAAPLKKVERQRLVAHLEMTQSWLQDEVAGLSAAQVKFRPSPGVWSVVEVVEHLHLAEPIYWQQLKDAVKAPPTDKKPAATDADVLWYGIDRTQRQKTEDRKSPHDESIDLGKGLDAFRKLHGEMLEYARTTEDELRTHLLPAEGVDAYQWILEISAHTQRHILQIREIKANPNFPKK